MKQRNKLIKRGVRLASKGKSVKLSDKLEGCLVATVGHLLSRRPENVWTFLVKNGEIQCSLGQGDPHNGNHYWWAGDDVVILDTNFKG